MSSLVEPILRVSRDTYAVTARRDGRHSAGRLAAIQSSPYGAGITYFRMVASSGCST
jgi:hypothetical protein